MFFNSLAQVPPSEYICLASGIIISTNGNNYSIIVVIFVASIFNLLGTLPWYLLGRSYKHMNENNSIARLISRFPLIKSLHSLYTKVIIAYSWIFQLSLIKQIYALYTDRLSAIADLYEKHGFFLVGLLRNVPVIRSVCSYPAGYIRMAFIPFLMFSFTGILFWITIWTLVGKLLGLIAVEYHWTLSFVIGIISITILKVAFSILDNQLQK